MNPIQVIALTVLGMIVCGLAGLCAANAKNAAVQGFLAGFALGPLGVLAALGFDNRLQCPRCAGRLDGMGHVCQHCRVSLSWSQSGKPIVRPEHQQPPDQFARALADIEADNVKVKAKDPEWRDLRAAAPKPLR